MNTTTKHIFRIAFLGILLLMMPAELEAQRFGHGASRGGGRSMQSRPSSSMNRQARPSTSNRSSTINGGHQRSSNRSYNKPQTSNRTNNRSTNRTTNRNNNRDNDRVSDRSNRVENRSTNRGNGARTSDVKRRDGDRNVNRNSNNRNVDRSRRNINIDNSRNVTINRRNTYVRPSYRPYVRPPYVYGGFRFYCHTPYFWHPYRPFYWGPYWHPWGYFVTTIATTAIIVSIVNDSGDKEEYHYDEGNYYVKTEDGYEVVQAPVGATVDEIPKSAEKVEINETTNNYYYGGAFYEKNAEGYTVVPAVAGTIVPHLPEGGEEVKVGDQTYVVFGETYYQPIQVDGKDMYEIVEVKEDS